MIEFDKLYKKYFKNNIPVNTIRKFKVHEDLIEIGEKITFNNFDKTETGIVKAILCCPMGYIGTDKQIFEEMFVVWKRNPYGGHNLIIVDSNGNAIAHGNEIALRYAKDNPCVFKKLLKFLYKKNKLTTEMEYLWKKDMTVSNLFEKSYKEILKDIENNNETYLCEQSKEELLKNLENHRYFRMASNKHMYEACEWLNVITIYKRNKRKKESEEWKKIK